MGLSKREFLLYSSSALALAAVAPAGALAASGAEKKEIHMNAIAPIIRKADDLSQDEVFAWLKTLRGHPYVAQSGFDVTSVFKVNTPAGSYYVGGVNVENRELTTGTCAEEGALATAITAFGQNVDVVEGWVMGAPKSMTTSNIACYPCGECRQRIAQYAAEGAPIHMMGLNGKRLDTKTRGQLLPNAFSFRDLEHNGAATAAPPLAAVAKISDRLYQTPEKPLTKTQIYNWLTGLRGDVRVSDYNEMAVWRLAGGVYVAGVKVENAAYPSSTNVMATTAAVMNAHFGHKPVEEVWVHAFYNDAVKQTAQVDKHHVSTGASLQILREFAEPSIKIHQFNGRGMTKTSTLQALLSQAPRFS